MRRLIDERRVTACHDLADGGLAVALAEMALAGGTGARLERPAPAAASGAGWWFGEDQGRYLVTAVAAGAEALIEAAARAGVPAQQIGLTGGDALILGTARPISLSELRAAHEAWLPRYMSVV